MNTNGDLLRYEKCVKYNVWNNVVTNNVVPNLTNYFFHHYNAVTVADSQMWCVTMNKLKKLTAVASLLCSVSTASGAFRVSSQAEEKRVNIKWAELTRSDQSDRGNSLAQRTLKRTDGEVRDSGGTEYNI